MLELLKSLLVVLCDTDARLRKAKKARQGRVKNRCGYVIRPMASFRGNVR